MKSTFKILTITCLAAVSAFGGTITYVTAPGATVGGGAGEPVSTSAEFTTSTGLLSINLTNLLTGIKDVGQALSDLSWTFDSSLVGTALSSSSGNTIDVHSDGTYTSSGLNATGWELDSTGLRICALCADIAGPSRLILGPPDGSNVYSSANSSIAGNGPHNPFLNGTVNFQIAVAGLTADSTVTSATFSFGTTEGSLVPGGCVGDCGGGGPPAAIPEPSTWLLLSGGGLLFAFGRRKLVR